MCLREHKLFMVKTGILSNQDLSLIDELTSYQLVGRVTAYQGD